MTIDNPDNLLPSNEVEYVLGVNDKKYACPNCGGVLLVLKNFVTCRHCKQYHESFETKGNDC